MKIGIDLSLRSSGITLVNYENEIQDISVVQHKEKDDYILLLRQNKESYRKILTYYVEKFNISNISVEGLSYSSKSSYHDVISANWWSLMDIIYDFKIPTNIFSPNEWRKYCKIVPKGIKKTQLKQQFGNDYLKILALNKMDEIEREKILEFVSSRKLAVKSKYDICDSYWIAVTL